MVSDQSFTVLAREVGRDGSVGPWRAERSFPEEGEALDWADYLREDGNTETKIESAECVADRCGNRAAWSINTVFWADGGSSMAPLSDI